MSGTWSGFTEDDIKKLSSSNGTLEVEDQLRRKVKAKRRLEQRKVIENNIFNNSQTQEPISEDARLSKTSDTLQNPPVHPKLEQKETIEIMKESKLTNNFITLNTCKIEKKVIDLEEFQTRQKLVEEQNRIRKELLAKALADRTKRTEEEARRLKEIQNEFKKLDAILSNDVCILRHEIELASLEFMEAQKRYNKIEKEFLDAKLNLHHRLEKKEMLTEHLCAIIEKNEERKAEKLNELINRLAIGDKTNETMNCVAIGDKTDDIINDSELKTEIGNSDTNELVLENSCNKESQKI